MKTTLVTTTLTLTSVALFAGEPAPYIEAAPMSPPPEPTLLQWFAGGSVGYFFDNEEEFYSGHIGFDLPTQSNGVTHSFFLEVGYTEYDERETVPDPDFGLPVFDTAEVAAPGGAPFEPQFINNRLEVEIIPITLNYKVESPFTQNLSGYFGLGAGVALVDAEISGVVDDDDDDTTFYGQVFAGLLYNFSESFELFSGVRWVYIDGADLFGFDTDSDDDFVGELGFRFNF